MLRIELCMIRSLSPIFNNCFLFTLLIVIVATFEILVEPQLLRMFGKQNQHLDSAKQEGCRRVERAARWISRNVNSSSEISSEKSDRLQQGPFQAPMASFDSSFKRTASPTQPQRRTEWQGKCAGLKDAMSGLTCIA